MSRIRSIKPEFWTSAQIMECAPVTRLFFIGLWNFCDDHGRHPAAPKQLKALVFPGDDMSVEIVQGMVDELCRQGLIAAYTVEGKDFLQVTGWQHQKIDKPQKAKYPGAESGQPRRVGAHSSNGIDGREGIGKGREGNPVPNGTAAPQRFSPSVIELPLKAPPDPDSDLFRRGREILGKSAGGQVSKLKSLYGGDVAKARAFLETAAGRDDAAEYVAATINKNSAQSRASPSGRDMSGYTNCI